MAVDRQRVTRNVYVDGSVDPSWQLAASDDFNGDGRTDKLWRQNTGAFTEWQSTGNGFTPNVYFDGSFDASWQVAQPVTSMVTAAPMSFGGKVPACSTGNGFTPNVYFDGSVDLSWQIAASGDFNNDGRTNILWRQNDGAFTEWQSTGNNFVHNAYVDGTVASSWTLQAPH
jgi:hypothetical protein